MPNRPIPIPGYPGCMFMVGILLVLCFGAGLALILVWL